MTQDEVGGIIHKLDNMEDKIDSIEDKVTELTIQTAKNTMITSAVKYVSGSAFVAFLSMVVFFMKEKLG